MKSNFIIISDIGNTICRAFVGVYDILYWEIFFYISALGFINAVYAQHLITNDFLNVLHFVINSLRLFS